jgi:DoxX-like family
VITTTAGGTAGEARPRRLTSTLLWAAQILLAVLFVAVAAVPKLKGSHQEVQEFGLIGAGQWLRYFVGTAELAGAIGLARRVAALRPASRLSVWPPARRRISLVQVLASRSGFRRVMNSVRSWPPMAMCRCMACQAPAST